MADLSSIERRKLERLLRMGGGYVLDFSDRTFREFFEEHTRRDIEPLSTASVAPPKPTGCADSGRSKATTWSVK
jgi:hypothetical protein